MSKNFKKLKILIFFSSVLLVVLISVFNQSVTNRMIKEPLNSFGLVNSDKIYVFSKLHETYYKTALNILKIIQLKALVLEIIEIFAQIKSTKCQVYLVLHIHIILTWSCFLKLV